MALQLCLGGFVTSQLSLIRLAWSSISTSLQELWAAPRCLGARVGWLVVWPLRLQGWVDARVCG
jgi:hypothetical protein